MHQRLYQMIIAVIRMAVQRLVIRSYHSQMIDFHYRTGSATVARASRTRLTQIVVVAAKEEGIWVSHRNSSSWAHYHLPSLPCPQSAQRMDPHSFCSGSHPLVRAPQSLGRLVGTDAAAAMLKGLRMHSMWTAAVPALASGVAVGIERRRSLPLSCLLMRRLTGSQHPNLKRS